MTLKQIGVLLGGLVIGLAVTMLVLLWRSIPLESFGPVNATACIVLFGLVGVIGLDSLFKAGFLSK